MHSIFLASDAEYDLWPEPEDDETGEDEFDVDEFDVDETGEDETGEDDVDEDDEAEGAVEDVTVVVVLDPDDSLGVDAVASVGDLTHEGDGVMFLSQTDGWAERTLEGDTLHIDFIVYRQVLEHMDVEHSAFTERSTVDADAVRVLRVSATVDPEVYARAGEPTMLFFAENAGASLDETLTQYEAEEEAPWVLAPAPDPNSLSER